MISRFKIGICGLMVFLANPFVSAPAWSEGTYASKSAKALPPGIAEEVAKADAAFAERSQEKKAREALERYRLLYFKNQDNPELAWRFAMASYFVGLRLTKDSDDKEKIFSEGRQAGLAAVKKDADCAPCHFWTAINTALYGQTVGVFKTLSSIDEVKEHLRDTVKLDPNYAFGGPQRLLGLIEQKLPGLLGGSNKRAKAHFENAVQIAPDEPLNYLFLARLLDEELDQKEQAKEIAKKGSAVKVTDSARMESKEALETLQGYLETGKWKE